MQRSQSDERLWAQAGAKNDKTVMRTAVSAGVVSDMYDGTAQTGPENDETVMRAAVSEGALSEMPKRAAASDIKTKQAPVKLLKDTRRAVKPVFKDETSLKPLSPKMRSPPCSNLKMRSPPSSRENIEFGHGMGQTSAPPSSSSTQTSVDRVKRISSCGCLVGIFSLLRPGCVEEVSNTQPQQEAPRRWYRVHQISEGVFFVRPDPGMAGRTVGHPDAGPSTDMLTDEKPKSDNAGTLPVASRLSALRQNSVPKHMCRMMGLGESDFNDTFVNLCNLCCDRPANVVLLPCKHGGMCEKCLRKTLFMKPQHKGGHSCPMCRKQIKEVIKMYEGDSAIKQYGYAVSAGCFFEGKDGN